jgi:hypothetical protein
VRRIKAAVSGAFLCTLIWTSTVPAQGFEEGLTCSEKADTLYQGHRYPIMLLPGASPGQVKLLFGDLGGQCLPSPVVTSVKFMIKWVKRQLVGPLPPLIYKGQASGLLQYTLGTPVGPFILQDQSASDQALVRLLRMPISNGPDGTTSSGQLTLRRGNVGDWKIGSVITP